MESNKRLLIQRIGTRHVDDYDWLMFNQDLATSPGYQSRYRKYWMMNAARLGQEYVDAYFDLLVRARSNEPDIKMVASALYEIPCNSKGKKALQYSFSTKLLHALDPTLPIYDSQVAAFYFFTPPERTAPLDARLNDLGTFYKFLRGEHDRVLAEGLLQGCIHEFRSQLSPRHFTDQKIVDSLIWGFASLLRDGAVSGGSVAYR